MTKTLLILFIICSAYYSFGQKVDSSFVTNLEVKAFFNDTRRIINGGKQYFNLYDKPSKINFPGTKKELSKFLKMYRLDSFFTKNDIDYLVKQIDKTKTGIWESSYIDSAKFLNHRAVDSAFQSPIDSIRKGYGLPVHYRMTFPLFSKDKKTCYISTWYWCGRLCGQGREFIFKFINNHWELYRVFYGPVS